VDAQRIEADGIVSEYKYLPDGGTWDKINYPVVGYFIQMKDDPSSMRLYDSNTIGETETRRRAASSGASSYPTESSFYSSILRGASIAR